MKASRYNLMVPYRNESTILFNTLTCSIALLDYEAKNRLTDGIYDDQMKTALYERGFIVDKSVEESILVDGPMIEGITQNTRKVYRLWTTTACNANCFYCFESGIKRIRMDEGTARQVARFINSRTERNNRIELEWFGGEPLCNQEAINIITREVKSHCEDIGAEYRASIITNGSLISDEVANRMKDEWDITAAQVTLDGSKDYHNHVKQYSDFGQNGFDVTLDGVDRLIAKGVRVSIRMNYTTDNKDSLLELIDYLDNRFQKSNYIHYYLYPIWSSLNPDENNGFVSSSVADDGLLEAFEKLISKRMVSPRGLLRLGRKRRQCISCNEHSFAVLPDGKIAKCSEAFSIPIGDIWSGITNEDLVELWTTKTIEDDCRECVFLPLCLGGCRASKCTSMPKCFVFKPVFEKTLVLYMDYLKGLV